jgi:hypothetical protein
MFARCLFVVFRFSFCDHDPFRCDRLGSDVAGEGACHKTNSAPGVNL